MACRTCSRTKFLDVFEYLNSSSEGIYLVVGVRNRSLRSWKWLAVLINDWEQRAGHRSGSILGSYEKESKKTRKRRTFWSRWQIVLRVKILHPLDELLLSDLSRRR